MIRVTLSQLIFIGMVIGVAMVCFLWLVAVVADRRRDRKTRANIISCRICGCMYANSEGSEVSVCPSCQTPNEKNPAAPI